MDHDHKNYSDLTHDELVKRRCDWQPEAFEAFWADYPLRINKVHAMRAWDRLKLPEQELPVLMSYRDAYRACAWVRDPQRDEGKEGPFSEEDLETMPFLDEADQYYRMARFGILPADMFLFDQPWVL